MMVEVTIEKVKGLVMEWLKTRYAHPWVHEEPSLGEYKCMKCGWKGDELDGGRCLGCGAEIYITRWLAEGVW
ncbi:MAG: hypothetical protein ACE5Z5_08525 [Candidatus Bathyarchaeia archaeon]